MKDFKKFGGFNDRNKGGFSRPKFGGNKPRFDGGRDDRPMTMHKATCADCGNTCEVPFRPNGEKPVYCNDCFAGKRDNNDSRDRGNFSDRAPRRDFGARPERSERPFRSAPQSSAPNNDELKRQIDALHNKVDRLLAALKPASGTVAEKAVMSVAVKADKAPKKEAAKEVAKKAAPVKKVAAKKKAAPKKK